MSVRASLAGVAAAGERGGGGVASGPPQLRNQPKSHFATGRLAHLHKRLHNRLHTWPKLRPRRPTSTTANCGPGCPSGCAVEANLMASRRTPTHTRSTNLTYALRRRDKRPAQGRQYILGSKTVGPSSKRPTLY